MTSTPRSNPRRSPRVVVEDLQDLKQMEDTFDNLSADSSKFYHNVQTSLRGATAITAVVGLASVPGLVSELPKAYQNPLLLAMIGFWFVLTFGKTVGFVVRNAWQAIAGTMYAVLNSLIMNWVFPGGAKNEAQNGYREEVAWIDLAFAVFVILFLNVSDRCRTFALFYISMFMMHYMNPASTARFSRNFHIDIEGTGITYLVVCSIGTSLAIVAACVPWPRTDLQEVDRDVNSIRVALTTMLRQVVTTYNGEPQQATIRSKLVKGFRIINETLAAVNAKLERVWWEGFDLGSRGHVRYLISSYVKLLKELTDVARGLQMAAAQDMTVDNGVMQEMVPQISPFTERVIEFVNECWTHLADGDISEAEKAAMQAKSEDIARGLFELGVQYTTKRMEAGIPVLDIALLEEDYFMYNLGQMVQALERFTCTIRVPDKGQMARWAMDALLDCVDPDLDRNHWNFVLRGFISFMAAFIWAVMLGTYNFIFAATVALVMSKFMGSAIERNLGRMQGVVLGLVLPAIVLHQLPTCSGGLGTFLFLCIVFVFEAGALYVYRSASSRFSYIAMLTAAFAAQAFFQPCDVFNDESATSHTAYAKVTSTMTGIIIVLFVDTALSNERPTEAVRIHFESALNRIRAGLQCALDSKQQHRAQGLVQKDIKQATLYHNEACHEPRYWRAPYPEEMVEDILVLMDQLRLNLRSLEQTGRLAGKRGVEGFQDGQFHAIFAEVRKVPDFVVSRRDLLTQFDRVAKLLLSTLEHEKEEQNLNIVNYEHDDTVIGKVVVLCGKLQHTEYNTEVSILDDHRCRIAVAMFMFLNIHYRLADIVEVVLSN